MNPPSARNGTRRHRLVLTPEENRTLCFVLVVFLLGLGAKGYRASHSVPPMRPAIVQTAMTVGLPAQKRAEAKRRKMVK
jgi:hypothetical protein